MGRSCFLVSSLDLPEENRLALPLDPYLESNRGHSDRTDALEARPAEEDGTVLQTCMPPERCSVL